MRRRFILLSESFQLRNINFQEFQIISSSHLPPIRQIPVMNCFAESLFNQNNFPLNCWILKLDQTKIVKGVRWFQNIFATLLDAKGVQKSLIDIVNHISMSWNSIVTTKSPFAGANRPIWHFYWTNVNRITPPIRKTPTN